MKIILHATKRSTNIFAGNMVDAGISTEEERHPEQPLNNEEGNIRNGELWEDLNDSQDNKYELKQNVNEVRSELRKVKVDNE